MTTYAAVEAALLTVVRGLTGLTADNTSRGDFRVLDAEGVTYSAVVYQRGPSTYGERGPNGRGTHGKRVEQHRLRVMLAAKRGQDADGPTYEALQTQADALIARITLYPRLGGAVSALKRADVVEGGDPRVPERASHITKVIDVDALCEVAWNPVEQPQ